jgi:hypothetical protein
MKPATIVNASQSCADFCFSRRDLRRRQMKHRQAEAAVFCEEETNGKRHKHRGCRTLRDGIGA